MKKLKRIFFVLYVVGLFCLGAYLVHTDLFSGYFWERVSRNPVILIVTAWTFLSLPSLFFNLEKLGESGKKSKIYNFTRISDLIFSVYMIPVIILGLIGFAYFLSEEAQGIEISPGETYWPPIIMAGCLTTSILMFIDNIQYHKSLRNVLVRESIDDIGK